MGCAVTTFEKDSTITITDDPRPSALNDTRAAVTTKCGTRLKENIDASSSYQKVSQSVKYFSFM